MIKKIKKINNDFPWAFVLAFTGIILFESFNAVFDNYFYTKETETALAAVQGLDGFRIKIKNEFSRRGGHNYEILVLGDSYFISGVHPDMLEKKTKMSVFNLANFGDHGVFGSYCLLKNYLKSNEKKPKYIIFGYQPDTLSRIKIHSGFMYDLAKGNFFELIDEFGFSEGIKFQIPSLKHQRLLRDIFKEGIIKDRLSKSEIDSFIKDVELAKGYYAPNEQQAVGMPVTEEDYNNKYKFKVSYSARRNIERIVELADIHNIEILYVVPTFSYDWYDLYYRYGLIENYNSFVNELAMKSKKIHVVNLQSQIKKLEMYSDRLHLNIIGTEWLTMLIGDTINSYEKDGEK